MPAPMGPTPSPMKLLPITLFLGLAQAPLPAGDHQATSASAPAWVELFDGSSLEGWVTRGGRYDGDARWTVEEGAIVGREGPSGEGGLLYTARPYTSFELELETLVEYPFDSGVFLRMAPVGKGLQVTLDHRPGGEIGAIYADGFLKHNPEGERLLRRDGWNRLRLRCTGFDPRLEVWLNDEPLVEYELPAGTPGHAPTGLIGLQVHGGGEAAGSKAVRFRKLRIRELPIFGEGLFERDAEGLPRASERARAEGWEPLFDGRSLAGWEAGEAADAFAVEDGELRFLKAGRGGDPFTERQFGDFRLRLDFRMQSMANSGVFLRVPPGSSDPAFAGCEIQILDDFDWERVTNTKLAPYQRCGGLYGSVPAGNHGLLRPPGEWNSYEILYQGSRLAVALNGRTLYDVDTFSVPGLPPFRERARHGAIGLQRYSSVHVRGDEVIRFRDLFVQEL